MATSDRIGGASEVLCCQGEMEMKRCWFIPTAPICRADDGLKFKENGLEDITANSAKWQSLLRKWRLEEQANKRKAAAYVVEREKQKKLGRDLFGVDERWAKAITGKEDFSGAVAVKSPRDFQVGDWGCHDLLYTVVQRVEPDTALVCLERFTDEPMLLKGLDFSKVVDGTKFILQRPILISGTESYETVAGGSKTVFRIECDLKKVEAQALLEANAGLQGVDLIQRKAHNSS